MEIKYKVMRRLIVSGFLCFVVAALQGYVIFLSLDDWNFVFLLWNAAFLLTYTFLGIYFLRAHKINYVVINEETLLFKVLLRKVRKVEIKDIENIECRENKLILQVENEKELVINMNFITQKDAGKLEQKLIEKV